MNFIHKNGLYPFLLTGFLFYFVYKFLFNFLKIHCQKSASSFGYSDSDPSNVFYFLIYASQEPYSEDILLYYYVLYISNIALLKFLFCLPLKFARLADFFHSTQTNIKVGSRKSIGKDPKLVCCATQNFSGGHPRTVSTI